jgi:hypothetical protein
MNTELPLFNLTETQRLKLKMKRQRGSKVSRGEDFQKLKGKTWVTLTIDNLTFLLISSRLALLSLKRPD